MVWKYGRVANSLSCLLMIPQIVMDCRKMVSPLQTGPALAGLGWAGYDLHRGALSP